MVMIKDQETISKNWIEGMIRTMPVPCPNCRKKSSGKDKCRWCGVYWTLSQKIAREALRKTSPHYQNIRSELCIG